MIGFFKHLALRGFWPGTLAVDSDPTVTATGATQGTAYVIKAGHTVCTTVAASTGVVLPKPGGIGEVAFVQNVGANSLSLYPPLGGKVNNGAANAAAAVAANKAALCIAVNATDWAALIA